MFKPTLHASEKLDRQSEKRSDEAYIAALLAAPETRFLVLAGHKPVILPNDGADQDEIPHGRIRWFTQEQMRELGLPVSEAYFLGVDPEDNSAKFAIAVSEHRARNSPGSVHLMRPIRENCGRWPCMGRCRMRISVCLGWRKDLRIGTIMRGAVAIAGGR